MKNRIGIFNGSGLNRCNIYTPISVLESVLNQCGDLGLPSAIGHDIHRIYGWSKPLSLLTADNRILLSGIISIPENDADRNTVIEAFRKFESQQYIEDFQPTELEFRKILDSALTEDGKALISSCNCFYDIDIVNRIFPQVFKEADEDGLVSLKTLKSDFKYVGQGAYRQGELVIFAHPYFRRSLSRHNSHNGEFLDLLNSLTLTDDIRIAIDKDLIGYSKTLKTAIELEYWWGPKFSNTLGEITNGVTRHNANEAQRLYHGISATEFWWHEQNALKTLECEELCDLPTVGINVNMFGCRYVHTILSEDRAQPNHCDGAIRAYDEAKMIARLDSDILKFGRNSQYTKLWRIDGNIPVDVWKNLLNHYFRDNHLIGEYFGGKDSNGFTPTAKENESEDSEVKSILRFVPFNIKASEPTVISVTFIFGEYDSDITEIWPTHKMGSNSYIESDFIEILKLFKRNSRRYIVKDTPKYITFDDMVHNYPLIVFTGANKHAAANKTNQYLLQLTSEWVKRKDDRLLSYNIGLNYKDKIVCFSIAGHVNALHKWLSSTNSDYPDCEQHLSDWLEKQQDFIKTSFAKPIVNEPVDLLHESGLLHFDRRFIAPSIIEFKFNNKSHVLEAIIKAEKDNEKLADMLTTGKIQVCGAFIDGNSKCSKCGGSYINCNCSKYLDAGVTQIMQDCPPVGSFFTCNSSWVGITVKSN